MTKVTTESPANRPQADAASARKRRHIGPYSREGVFAVLDGRSPDALYLKRKRAELTAHVGTPSATQRLWIDRVAILSLRLDKLDQKMLLGEGLTDHDVRTYLSWCSAVARALKVLGLKAAPAPRQSLADYIADKSGKAA